MKIKVCDKCGAVRTKKNCTKCEEQARLIHHSAVLMARAAQESPGLVAAAIQEMKDNLDPDAFGKELNKELDTIMAELQRRALQSMM